MEIWEAFDSAIDTVAGGLKTAMQNLLSIRRSGKPFQKLAEENGLFLSGKEEDDDYFGADLPTFETERDTEGGAFNFDNAGLVFDLVLLLSNTLEIHKRRGTLLGISADIKRLCNTDDVSIEHLDETQCGWILGVTAPDFNYDGDTYSQDNMNMLMDLIEQYLITVTDFNSNRSKAEATKIIRRYFIPIIASMGVIYD